MIIYSRESAHGAGQNKCIRKDTCTRLMYRIYHRTLFEQPISVEYAQGDIRASDISVRVHLLNIAQQKGKRVP